MTDVNGPAGLSHRLTDPSIVVAHDSLTVAEARYVAARPAPSPTKHATAPWPPSAPTSASTKPGTHNAATQLGL